TPERRPVKSAARNSELGFSLHTRAMFARVVARRAVRTKQVAHDRDAPFGAGIDIYADAIGAVFFETRELTGQSERRGQIGRLADENAFVACAAVSLVAEDPPGNEVNGAKRVELRL